jgi:hypothetical protein
MNRISSTKLARQKALRAKKLWEEQNVIQRKVDAGLGTGLVVKPCAG